MKTVIVIEKDNHGLIGVAKDYPSVIDFLVNKNWLDGNFEVLVDNEDYLMQSIKDRFGENWKEIISTWDIKTFNNYFASCFYLSVVKVYGAD